MITTTVSMAINTLLRNYSGTRYIRLACLGLLMFSNALSSQAVFVHENRDPEDSEYESTILCVVDDKEVGHICIRKLPLFHFYVLHTLYVHPEHRLNGYGRNLVEFACNYLISQDASRIYIQPGPFELDANGHLVKPFSNYKKREQALVTLYAKCGFESASQTLRACAFLLYKCLGISEDPKYLMVKLSN